MRSLPLVLLLAATGASAQITPRQPYNGIQRPLVVEVRVPRGMRGEATVQLIKPGATAAYASAKVRSGRNDLAALFPLWSQPQFAYAQLVVGDRPVGPALVLQPMLNPPISRLAADGKTAEFVGDEDGPMYNGMRAFVDRHLVIETSLGEMEFRLRPDAAPNTAWNIRQLAEGGLYTDSIFHRVVAKRADGTPFVIQGGDPTGTGSGGPGWAYPLENSPLPHDFGVISIARSTDPNTNGCQFFVCLSREGTKHLDGRYASFGQCIRGADTILKIGAVPVGAQDRPVDPPKIRRVYLRDAKPYLEESKPLARPQ